MSVQAQGKLNLALRVLGRAADGYHDIETLFVRLAIADEIDVDIDEAGIRLEVRGPAADGPGGPVPEDEQNLCWRAAEALYSALDEPPHATIRLTKRIPSAAGLGGGSADAAAVLRELNRQLGAPLSTSDLVDLAVDLGSDVPFFVTGAAAAIGRGRGHRLLPITPPPPRPALVLAPSFGVSAADAYRWWSEDAAATGQPVSGAAVLPEPARLADWRTLAELAGNDLEAPVVRRHDVLASAIEGLREAGAFVAMLCGSGACVAGLFDDEAVRDDAARLWRERGGAEAWRTLQTATVGPGG